MDYVSKIDQYLNENSIESFDKAVELLCKHIDEVGEISNMDRTNLYILFYNKSEYVLDYIKIDINKVKSQNALEDSIFFSMVDFMRKRREHIPGVYVNEEILIGQILQMVILKTKINNILKIRNILGETLFYDIDKVLESSERNAQELYEHNEILLTLV